MNNMSTMDTNARDTGHHLIQNSFPTEMGDVEKGRLH